MLETDSNEVFHVDVVRGSVGFYTWLFVFNTVEKPTKDDKCVKMI